MLNGTVVFQNRAVTCVLNTYSDTAGTVQWRYRTAKRTISVDRLCRNCCNWSVGVTEWSIFRILCRSRSCGACYTVPLSLHPPTPHAKGLEGANRRFLRKAGNLIIYETRQIVCEGVVSFFFRLQVLKSIAIIDVLWQDHTICFICYNYVFFSLSV